MHYIKIPHEVTNENDYICLLSHSTKYNTLDEPINAHLNL